MLPEVSPVVCERVCVYVCVRVGCVCMCVLGLGLGVFWTFKMLYNWLFFVCLFVGGGVADERLLVFVFVWCVLQSAC